MRILFALCFMALASVLLCPVPSLVAQETDTKKQEDNARNFAFAKINFSMTLAEFKEQFPLAFKGNKETNEKIGFYRFDIQDPNEVASGVTAWFYDDKLLEIAIVYNMDGDRRLEKIGGGIVLLKRLEAKFGQFGPFNFSEDKVKNVTKIWWPMTNANRHITLVETRSYVTINVSDTALQKRVDARKAKEADVGF